MNSPQIRWVIGKQTFEKAHTRCYDEGRIPILSLRPFAEIQIFAFPFGDKVIFFHSQLGERSGMMLQDGVLPEDARVDLGILFNDGEVWDDNDDATILFGQQSGSFQRKGHSGQSFSSAGGHGKR